MAFEFLSHTSGASVEQPEYGIECATQRRGSRIWIQDSALLECGVDRCLQRRKIRHQRCSTKSRILCAADTQSAAVATIEIRTLPRPGLPRPPSRPM